MINTFIKTSLVLVLVAFGGVAQAEVWTGAGDGTSYEDPLNWDPSTNAFAGTTRIIDGAFTVTRDVTANPDRTFVQGGATLNIPSGAHSDGKSGNTIRNFIGNGSLGTVNMSGGTYGIGHVLAIAHSSNSDGTFNLTGGDLNVFRGGNSLIGGYGGIFSRGHSVTIGGNNSNTGVTGLMEISGGSLNTRVGMAVGKNGTFSIVGSGASAIRLGGSGDDTGWFALSADGLLKASVDAGGITKIFVEDKDNTSTLIPMAELQAGSLLEVTNTTAYGGTWTLLEVENGGITNNGLAFAPGVDTNVWSFAVDNSGSNGILTITAQGDPIPVVTPELIGHWQFEGGSATNSASSGSAYDGTIMGSPAVVGGVEDGTSALEFDGNAANYVSIPAGVFDTVSNEITIAMWTFGDPDILGDGSTPNSSFGCNIRDMLHSHTPWNNGNLYWDAGNVRHNYNIAEASKYEGQWNHCIFTMNVTSGVKRVYINGVQDSPEWSSTLSPISGITAFNIGRAAHDAIPYHGKIDDFRLYNYEISADEIFAISRPAWHVEAEDYDAHYGLKLEGTADVGGGTNVGWIDNGDWGEYTINVETTGLHKIDFRVASNNGDGSIDIVSGGSSIGSVYVGGSGGWQTWKTVSAYVNFTSTGTQTLRLEFVVPTAGFNVNWFSYEPAGDPIAITVGNTRKQQMRYGIDYERLWFWSGADSVKDRFAEWSVDDCDVDYVRVAVSAKYELNEGTYREDAYFDMDDLEDGQHNNDRIIPMMQDMQAANPDIKFFASPRPLNEAFETIGIAKNDIKWQPYPIWITGAPSYTNSTFSFNEVKCSEYLLRYLILMKAKGLKISYMDLSNEWNYVNAQDVRDISALFDDYLDGTKPVVHPDYPTVTLTADDIPQLVAPSAWNYTQGASWMGGVLFNSYREALDIASCHNTDKGGTAADFADKVNEMYDGQPQPVPEIWNTEVHGWKSTSNADEVLTFAYMLECINAGFSGLNGWLAVGYSDQGHCYIVNKQRSVKYYIFEKLTTTSNRGYALDVNEPDEFKEYWDADPDQADADSAVSALIRGNLMTVWVLNHSDTDYPVAINPTGRTISDEPIKFTRWSQVDGLSSEGETGSVAKYSDTSVFTIVKDNSAYCFEILLEPETVPYVRVEAESYDGSSPVSHSTEACADIGGGLNLSSINDGNWTRYDDIDLDHAESIRLRVAAPAGQADGKIEIRTGTPFGTLIGKVAVPVTGGWQDWCTIETPLDPTNGTHDLYLVYVEADSNEAASSVMFNLNWFELTQTETPSSITESPVSGTQVTLTWNAVPGAIGYTVKRSTTQGGAYAIVDDTITETTYTDTGLTPGVTYYYVIVARYGNGDESDESGEVVAVPSDPIVVEDLNFESPEMNLAGDNVDIELLNSVPGHIYQGQEKKDLTTGDWMDVGAPKPGNGGVIIFDFPVGPTDAECFYRITIERQ
ncbi:Arabinoxylan arabinofuranohydrolase [Pontiella desulfatans]|uniref:Arabinoxylan arabinofuranohydrolase n=1 Tax=Pontiella desulfatans TaxID=2750659 RepID=A0A6C2TVW4_PONDE|nr:carbohydrate-binding protein [Pontiella desulfatans]VGO11743.1 Arabinoxylan arabinofuranohydrolase [Pontiella desulfatans]